MTTSQALHECHACGKPAKWALELTVEPQADDDPRDRYFLPNQVTRSQGLVREIWFCQWCTRAIEDAVRREILYLQSEHGRLPSVSA